MKPRTILALALLLAGGATLGFAQDRERARARDGSACELGASGAPGHGLGRFAGRRARARAFLRSLRITPEQRETARRAARDLRPLADELRPEIRGAIERARELARSGDRAGARELLREELRPLVQEARLRAGPLARPLVDSLTPEQRARCAAAARRFGRELDPDRAAGRLGPWLGARRTGERPERRAR